MKKFRKIKKSRVNQYKGENKTLDVFPSLAPISAQFHR